VKLGLTRIKKLNIDLITVLSKRRLAALPNEGAQRDLRYPHSFLSALESAQSQLQKLFQSCPGLRTIHKTAPVLAILFIMIGFLIWETGHHGPAQTIAPRSQTTALEKAIPLRVGSPRYGETVGSDDIAMEVAVEARVSEPIATTAPVQVSHVHITDRRTENAIRILSHYELAGLSRRALYGDDSAAFLMGMVYEIGHGVRQNCKTAAQWVAKAAAEGNAAAQYNLGLRYRDGDGVPVNREAAMKWLQKAAAQQTPEAQLALVALTSQSASPVASQPWSEY
jgi:hypothetical protein